MSKLWIDPEMTVDDKHVYSATLSDLDIRVRMVIRYQSLQFANGRCYQMDWDSQKAARGPLGPRQKEKAKALKAELEPQFRAALAAAGWSEQRYGIYGMLWTRDNSQ